MTKFNKIFILGILILLTNLRFTYAENYSQHWEFSGWYGGGCYWNIEFDPSIKGRVYLVSDLSGIWKSDDLGENWRYINNGLGNLNVASLVISPLDSNIVYAATNKGLYVSKNAGEEWQGCNQMNGEIAFKQQDSYRCIVTSSKKPNEVYIGTAKGEVFYSDNSGKDWQLLFNFKTLFNSALPVTALALSNDNQELFVSSSRGLVKYLIKKHTWEILTNSPKNITDFVISNKKNGVIFAAGDKHVSFSLDSGNTWNSAAPMPHGSAYRIAIDESEDILRIYATCRKYWNGGMVMSNDLGLTWIPTDKNMVPDIESDPTRLWAGLHHESAAFKIDPFNSSILFFTDLWGVWRSDDKGKSWHEKIKGTPNTSGSDVFLDSKDALYAATMDDGLLKSTDGGKHFESIFPRKGYNKSINGHVWRVLSYGKNGENVIATSSPWNEDINQIILSRDTGENFEIIREGLPQKRPRKNTMWGQGYPRALALDPNNPNNVYLGIDGDDGGGLFISNNGGRSWEYSSGQPGSRRIYNALAVDPTDSNRIFWGACGKDGGVYVSQDRGKTWKYAFSEMKWVFDMTITKTGVIYIAGAKNVPTLYVSYDHGLTWNLLKQFSGKETTEGLCIDSNNPSRIAVSTVNWGGAPGGKIYLSDDGGKNWSDITGDLPEGNGAVAMAFNKDSSYLYMIRYAGSVYRLKI